MMSTFASVADFPPAATAAPISGKAPAEQEVLSGSRNEIDLPGDDFRIRVVDDLEELEALARPWNRLMAMAVHRNPFFDPDFLIPAIRHLGGNAVRVLVVDAPVRNATSKDRVICALAPVVKRRIYGMPLRAFEVWEHDQCFDATPLIRQDCASQALDFLFQSLHETLGCQMLGLGPIMASGRFGDIFSDALWRSDVPVFSRDEFTRACFLPRNDADSYIMTEVSSKTRKGTLRLRRKLERQGPVVTQVLETVDPAWIDAFLELEAAGWKGQQGTALANTQGTAAFFREMTRRKLANGKARFTKVTFKSRPVSMLCDLLQGDSGAAFKTAFDESMAEWSPGLMAELDNIHTLHDRGTRFLDSCAAPDHSMINRVWSDRVQFRRCVVATGGTASGFAVSLMPLIQQFARTIRTKRNAK